MNNEPNEMPPPYVIEASNHHKSKLSLVSAPLDAKYSEALWNIVSGAIECGGLGGDSWGFHCHPKSSWKEYNEARDKEYTPSYPSAIVRLEADECPDDSSEYYLINAQWLHNRLVRFVNDEKAPMYLRKQYGAMLLTREYPDDADACSDDAVMQHFFVGEIIYG
jgi:hypothetical protein